MGFSIIIRTLLMGVFLFSAMGYIKTFNAREKIIKKFTPLQDEIFTKSDIALQYTNLMTVNLSLHSAVKRSEHYLSPRY